MYFVASVIGDSSTEAQESGDRERGDEGHASDESEEKKGPILKSNRNHPVKRKRRKNY